MLQMEPESPKPAPVKEPHHPVPRAFVELYGLFAVLFVLLPEWMEELRHRVGGQTPQANPAVSRSLTLGSSARTPPSRTPAASRGVLIGARWALLIGIGAGMAWGVPRWLPQQGSRPKELVKLHSDLLVLSAKEPSWLEVRSLKGQTLYEGIFQGTKQFRLAGGLKVSAGRPDLVNAAVGAGRPQQLGRIDQIRWVFFEPAPLPPT